MKVTLDQYLENHTTPPSSLLEEVYRNAHLTTIYPRMLSGPIQGKFLEMISRMIQPKNILEIGTFTGYSAICLANGMSAGGRLTTIEVDEELEDVIIQHFESAGLKDKISLMIGNALEILPQLNETYDLIFLDADKVNYPHYYTIVMEKLRSGGFLLADNVLWGMKVLDDSIQDFETKAIRQFNDMVAIDSHVHQVLLPMRDGLMLIQKH
ncbi:MAG: O-methyltransferase family 3 [Bacteroidetes bacterium]|nr:MAG: O-methyltransferase family 3 [Bacteroidota bacterium]